ncbi:MAG: cation:proton antiporter [Bacteroidales bacterium]|jgi:Kef-type K+ transport system membrane component KefB
MISLNTISFPLQDPILIITVMFMVILLSPLLLERIKIPSIAGLLIFGMLIGPNVFDVIPTNLEFSLFSTIGLMYLMFLAGLEIDLIDFLENKGKSLILGLLSFLFPFVLGFTASYYLLDLGTLPSLLLGSMLSSHTLISYPIASKSGIISTTIVTIIIGGTIIADVFALVSLQLISDYASGLFNTSGFLRMGANFLTFGVIQFYVIPRLAKEFFKYFDGDLIIQYIFIMTLLFLSAAAATLLHIEPIIGAFFCGLVLNRNIINGSPLYMRIEFIGNSLFIPVFLISVGLLVNPGFYLDQPLSLIPLVLLIVMAVAGKYIAAILSQYFFKLKKFEGNLIFGLTTSRAASAIAIVLVGYKLGLLNEVMINHTVVLILTTSILSTYITQHNAKKVADASKDTVAKTNEIIMVPVSNPANMNTLLRFASILKQSDEKQSVYAVSVMANIPTIQQQISRNKKLFKKVVDDLHSDVSFKLITRIDSTVTNGISKAMEELSASIMILGWHEKATPFDVLFGNVINHVLNKTTKMIWVVKTPSIQFNNGHNIHLFLPEDADYESGFEMITAKVDQISRKLKDKLILHTTDNMITRLDGSFKKDLKGYYQEAIPHQFSKHEIDLINPTETDLFLIVSFRKNSLSYNKQYDKFTMRLIKKYNDMNIVFIYPEQV